MPDPQRSFCTATEAALAFAAALDRGNWDGSIGCLTANCQYAFRGQVSEGAENIVSSYRIIGEWVDETFESVRYESSVDTIDPDTAKISFRDLLDHKGHSLDFRCQQLVTLGEDNLISRIEHIDIEGMPEKADAFNKACGVTKPQSNS